MHRRTTVLTISIAVVALTSGCAANAAQPTPAPSQVKTVDELVGDLTEYTDPADLSLPAGATAEVFGTWIVGLDNEWRTASCNKSQEVVSASVDTHTESTEFFGELAASNAAAFIVAMFGSNWQSNELAVRWNDGLIKSNALSISKCIQNKVDEVISEKLISATDAGQDADGSQRFDVTILSSSADPNARGIGEHTYTYTVGEESGNTVVKDITINDELTY